MKQQVEQHNVEQADILWHDKCKLTYKGTSVRDGLASFWCENHGQNAYVMPTKTTMVFEYSNLPTWKIELDIDGRVIKDAGQVPAPGV